MIHLDLRRSSDACMAPMPAIEVVLEYLDAEPQPGHQGRVLEAGLQRECCRRLSFAPGSPGTDHCRCMHEITTDIMIPDAWFQIQGAKGGVHDA